MGEISDALLVQKPRRGIIPTEFRAPAKGKKGEKLFKEDNLKKSERMAGDCLKIPPKKVKPDEKPGGNFPSGFYFALYNFKI